MSTSTDGGLTWGGALTSAVDGADGLGGQPVVQPNGTVIVPFASSPRHRSLFRSINGGASWRDTVQVSACQRPPVAGGLRSEPLPSRRSTPRATSTSPGRTAASARLHLERPRHEHVDQRHHLVGASRGFRSTPPPAPSTTSSPDWRSTAATSGTTARLGLAYYYYPNAAAPRDLPARRRLVFSATAARPGARRRTRRADELSWIARTNQGRMVGDYISTSFVNGGVRPVFASASAPFGGVFDESMFTTASALP